MATQFTRWREDFSKDVKLNPVRSPGYRHSSEAEVQVEPPGPLVMVFGQNLNASLYQHSRGI